MIDLRQFYDEETGTYTYLVFDTITKKAVLIDPVKEQVQRDLQFVKELDLTLEFVLDTHVHADHVTGSGIIREETGAKIVLGAATGVTEADLLIKDEENLQVGEMLITALSTPGHTEGCTTYKIKDMLFTGDALLIRKVGRTDFQQGNAHTLYKSIHEKIFSLPENTKIYPGHDYAGRTMTTVGEEKEFNLRIGGKSEEEFVKIMDELNLPKPKRIDIAVPQNMHCGLSQAEEEVQA